MQKILVRIANDKDLVKVLSAIKMNQATFQLFPDFELIHIENITYLLIIKN